MKPILITIGIVVFLALGVFQFRKPLQKFLPSNKSEPLTLIAFKDFVKETVTPQSISVIAPDGSKISLPATHGFALFNLKRQIRYTLEFKSLFKAYQAHCQIPDQPIISVDNIIDASLYQTD